jgi:hypothetical protein
MRLMSRWASVPSLKVRFQGMTSGVQRCQSQEKKLRRFLASGAGAFGAPSAWLFLIRLHACRAGLCFTRHHNVSSPFVSVKLSTRCQSRWSDVRTGKPLLYPGSRIHE